MLVFLQTWKKSKAKFIQPDEVSDKKRYPNVHIIFLTLVITYLKRTWEHEKQPLSQQTNWQIIK